MSELGNQSSIFYFGGSADDSLSVSDGVAIGLAGNDRLMSVGFSGSLHGGQGDDRYDAYADFTLIGDTGGTDTLYLPGYDYEAGFFDNRHLVVLDTMTEQTVIIWDFKGAGRIESLVNVEGISLSAWDIERYVYSDGYGDIPWSELQPALDMLEVSSNDFRGILENEMAMVQLNWDRVFTTLATQGRTDSDAFALAIKQEVWPMVSSNAHRSWDALGLSEALAASRYIGYEQNMPATTRPVLAYEQVADMALLYEAALGRKADAPGLNYFVSNLQDGQSLQNIARSFIDSAEFQQTFASFDNRSYIDKLYQNVLQRPADAAGMQYWLTDMAQNGRTQEDVLVSFAQSGENISNADWLAGLSYDAATNLWMV